MSGSNEQQRRQLQQQKQNFNFFTSIFSFGDSGNVLSANGANGAVGGVKSSAMGNKNSLVSFDPFLLHFFKCMKMFCLIAFVVV